MKKHSNPALNELIKLCLITLALILIGGALLNTISQLNAQAAWYIEYALTISVSFYASIRILNRVYPNLSRSITPAHKYEITWQMVLLVVGLFALLLANIYTVMSVHSYIQGMYSLHTIYTHWPLDIACFILVATFYRRTKPATS